MTDSPDMLKTPDELSRSGRVLILVIAFLGWFFAGMHMLVVSLGSRPAAIDLLVQSGELDLTRFQLLSKQAAAKSASPGEQIAEMQRVELKSMESLVAGWFSFFNCAFLFGAASGGLVFGWLGDHIGRSKGMAASIFTYSLTSAVAYFSRTPEQLVVLYFILGSGVGGMWPNGVALVSEVWSGMSRPMVAGIIGTAANVGQFLLATAALKYAITPGSWRWILVVGACPVVLGIFSLLMVPESPRWLATRGVAQTNHPAGSSIVEVFRPPLLTVTLFGIILATIPLIGGWATANWMTPWADQAGMAADPPNPHLKASVSTWRTLTGSIGSLLGGWIATYVGRRQTYSMVSLVSLFIAQATFWFLYPTDAWFLPAVAVLGFFSGIYFGWLPLFLPELFATRVRSTGAGVSFNFGRILTATTIFATGVLKDYFQGDYAAIGRLTSLLFIVGIVIVWFAPETSRKELDDT